jgi:hypothetical protein
MKGWCLEVSRAAPPLSGAHPPVRDRVDLKVKSMTLALTSSGIGQEAVRELPLP